GRPGQKKILSKPAPLQGLKDLLREEPVEGAGRGVGGQEEEPSDESRSFQPLMMSYTVGERQRGRARVRVENSSWSKVFGLDQAGTEGVLEIQGRGKTIPFIRQAGGRGGLGKGKGGAGGSSRVGRQEATGRGKPAFALGVSIKMAPFPFERTKVITLSPRYIVVNALGRGLEVRQVKVARGQEPLKVTVPVGGQAYFHWSDRRPSRRRLRVRVSEYGWEWSGALVPGNLGEVTLRLRNSHTHQVVIVRVEVSLEGASFIVVFSGELLSFAPYRIDNFSFETLTLRQAGVGVVETLLPYHTCAYTWDEPLGERSLVVELQGRG
ncbi:unnamed protein product, partial [Discosporangium mesarthrocarpum]